MRSGGVSGTSPCMRQSTRASTNVPSGLRRAFAWAMTASSSLFASSQAISPVTLPFLTTRYGVSMKPEVVDPRVAGERRDESDVRTFRRLDRAHAAVLRVVHVADLEPGALARQAARAEGRQAALVRQLGQRVGLVHELRQLRRAEERLDDRRDRAGVDEVVERDLLGIGVDRHALLDQARHARQADRELVGDQLAHRPDAAVAEMVDVVDVAAALVQLHEVADDRDEILAW